MASEGRMSREKEEVLLIGEEVICGGDGDYNRPQSKLKSSRVAISLPLKIQHNSLLSSVWRAHDAAASCKSPMSNHPFP